jgi:hypothetical protein
MVLTTEPEVRDVDHMNEPTILATYRKYVQFLYASPGRNPNPEEQKADNTYVEVRSWALVAKNENSINNYIEFRNDRRSIAENLVTATSAEEAAETRRMNEEAQHAEAGTGFLIQMQDFGDKLPEATVLAAIRMAEKTLFDKSVSNSSKRSVK